VALRIDHEIGLQPPAFGLDMRDALSLVEYSGFLDGKARPFTRLTAGDRDGVIRAMIDSRLAVRRTAIIGLKTAIAFFYYADDRTWKRTGYDGPWVPRQDRRGGAGFPVPNPGRKGLSDERSVLHPSAATPGLRRAAAAAGRRARRSAAAGGPSPSTEMFRDRISRRGTRVERSTSTSA
jgi:hypothetical protein